MARFRKIVETYFNGEKIYNFGGLVPEVFVPDPPAPSPTPTPTITPTTTLTPTPTPSITPTLTSSPTPTPTNTPSITPSITPTITPSATPNLYTQSIPLSVSNNFGVVSDLSGTTFGITYNGVEYLTNNYGGDGGQFTPYYASNCRTNIEEPSPGVIYDFTLTTIETGYTLTQFTGWDIPGFSGYDRYRVEVGSSIGTNIWSANTEYYSGATLIFTDTSPTSVVSTQLTGNTNGCYYDIRIGGADFPTFYVSKIQPLSTESLDEITTENDFTISPEQEITP